jgi:hypothetical protein
MENHSNYSARRQNRRVFLKSNASIGFGAITTGMVISEYGTPEFAAMIAPGALHLNFGENDSGSPIDSVRRGLTRIAEVYKNKGASDNFTFFIEPVAEYVLSDAKWLKVKECFAANLKKV